MTALYDRDFAECAVRNAELLRHGCFDQADITHIAEEIEDMAKRDHRELRSRIARISEHKLKLELTSGRIYSHS